MTEETSKRRRRIYNAILGVLCLLVLLLLGFVHAIVGIWVATLVLILLLLRVTPVPSSRLERGDLKATIGMGIIALLIILLGAAFVWHSYWNFEELLPLSPVGVPPYELTGLGATLFGAAFALLGGGAVAAMGMRYKPARILVVGAILLFWVPVILAFLRYGTRPPFVSIDEALVDTTVVLLFVLGASLGIFGTILNLMAIERAR